MPQKTPQTTRGGGGGAVWWRGPGQGWAGEGGLRPSLKVFVPNLWVSSHPKSPVSFQSSALSYLSYLPPEEWMLI